MRSGRFKATAALSSEAEKSGMLYPTDPTYPISYHRLVSADAPVPQHMSGRDEGNKVESPSLAASLRSIPIEAALSSLVDPWLPLD